MHLWHAELEIPPLVITVHRCGYHGQFGRYETLV